MGYISEICSKGRADSLVNKGRVLDIEEYLPEQR